MIDYGRRRKNIKRKKEYNFKRSGVVLPLVFCIFLHCDFVEPVEKVNPEISWQQTALTGITISSLAINHFDHIFAGNERADILKSTDSGETWDTLSIPNKNIRTISFSKMDDILASCRVATYRSTDYGTNWSIVAPDILIVVKDFALHPMGKLFALDAFAGVYFSTDDGNHWQPTNFKSGYYQTIDVNPKGDLFVGGLALNKSTDEGNSWFANWAIRGFPLTIDQNSNIFAGSADSIVRSTDGGLSWARIGVELTSMKVLVIITTVRAMFLLVLIKPVFFDLPTWERPGSPLMTA